MKPRREGVLLGITARYKAKLPPWLIEWYADGSIVMQRALPGAVLDGRCEFRVVEGLPLALIESRLATARLTRGYTVPLPSTSVLTP